MDLYNKAQTPKNCKELLNIKNLLLLASVQHLILRMYMIWKS